MAARAYKREGTLSPPPNGRQDPVAPVVGDRPLSPVGGGARQAPLFFLQGLRCKFEGKKITFEPCRPSYGDRDIFLKFFKTDIYF